MCRRWAKHEIRNPTAVRMSNHIDAILAAAGTASESMPGWIVFAVGVTLIFLLIGELLAIGTYFATRREVEDLKVRVARLEDSGVNLLNAINAMGTDIRREIQEQKDTLVLSADRRSSVLHNRINPVTTNLSEMKGAMEAFTQSFDNFTETIKAMNNHGGTRA